MRITKTFAALACGMSFVLIPAGYTVEVVINEIMAAPSERLVRWPANGVAHVGTGPAWQSPAFDSSSWTRAQGPFGYGFTDIRTDLEGAVRGKTPSLYLRKRFAVSTEQAALRDPLKFTVDYDDGFAAYLNGREIARRNLGAPGAFVYHDQPAFNARFGSGAETIAVGPVTNWLHSGENLLAIQVHDRGRPSDVRFKSNGTLQIDSEQPVSLISPEDSWEYFVGLSEPSGGIADVSVSGNPDFCDWIELFNHGAEAVLLEGWSLSDRADEPDRWVFPSVTLQPGACLLVLASGEDIRDPSAPFLHANFKLDADGEYLGLYDNQGRLVHNLGARFPRQVSTHSYGWDRSSGTYCYSDEPSPGRENAGARLEGIVSTPELSHGPGFHAAPLRLSMTAATSGATIRYTTDGSEPTLANGTTYAGTLELNASTALRARAFLAGWIPSDTITRTFLIDEPEAFESLSVVSLVADPEQALYEPHGVTAIVGGTGLFGAWRALGPADYNLPMEQGRPFERPASLEIIHPDQGLWKQLPLGLRVAGSDHTRSRYRLPSLRDNPWYGPWEDKPSFNLFFRKEYGPDRLDFPMAPGYQEERFHSLKLRSGKVDWNNPFVSDELTRRLFLDMGQVGSMGILVNLFVNGTFKCYYNLAERVTEPFLQDRHGSDRHWDVISDNIVEEGDADAWTSMLAYVRTNDMRVLEHYQAASQQLDMENLIDYLILNIYAGNRDWPYRNYMAARERQPAARYRFYVWDAEAVMDTDPTTSDLFAQGLRTSPGLPLPDLYQSLALSPNFRLLFADRVQRHFFNDGALTEERLRTRLAELATALDPAMRWVRDGTPVNSARLTDWIDRRRKALFGQFEKEGLWPSTLAPVFNHQGGEVVPGFRAELTNPNPRGTICFTTDGADPRNLDGSPGGKTYVDPITVDVATVIKARILENDGWSPLAEAKFTVQNTPHCVISMSVAGDKTAAVLTWSNSWILQASDDLENWADLPPATSPYTVSIGTATKRFWRLRMPGMTPGSMRMSWGQSIVPRATLKAKR